MTTFGSVIAQLASMIRCAGMVYLVVQVGIWHAFYTAGPWRLSAPAAVVAWTAVVVTGLRRRRPASFLVGVDAAVYVALALGAAAYLPPGVRDSSFSWFVIALTGQLLMSAWYAPGALAVPLTLVSPAAYWAGATVAPVTDGRTLAGTLMLLVMIGQVHILVRRALVRRAAAADSALLEATQAASEQYVILTRSIERREHERLLHDTVLNTLTALARAGAPDVAEAVNRCRGDVALITDALRGPGDQAPGAGRPPGDLLGEVQAVVADMRARGLSVHIDSGPPAGPAVPAPVTAAIANAAREALSNVAAHAGTGEAWVEVRLTDPPPDATTPVRLEVTVRDQGTGFDPARVDQARLGLRRSIAERTADCGGQASIWSAPGEGAVVRLTWPATASASW